MGTDREYKLGDWKLRAEEPNRLVLLRGERLYEEAIGETRMAVDRAGEKLNKFLDEMEYNS